MAINFLDNVQFNQNQLLGARLENVTSDPTSASGGDIIFNSTTGKFKYYDGTNPFNASGWIDPALGGVSGSGTIGTIPIFVTNTTTLGDSNLTVSGTGGSATLDIGYPFTVLKTLHVQGDLKDVNDQTGTTGQLLSSLGSGNGIDWIDAPVSYTKWVLTGDTGSQDIEDGNTVLVAGGTNITTEATATDTITINASTYTIAASQASVVGHDSQVLLTCNPGTNSDFYLDGTANEVEVSPAGIGTNAINIGLPTNVTISGDLTVSGGDITLGGTGRIQGVDTVTASTDAASKAYVDSSVAGGLNVKGGFNAATGAIATGGNLTVGASRVAIAIGDYYIVTTSGNFFGNASTPLTPGDSVLVQTAAATGASTINDFAVIQSDTDLATLTTIGIGNVNSNATANRKGLSLSYSGGTATVGLAIGSLPNSGAVSTLDPQNIEFALYNDDSSANERITLQQIQQGISASASGVISGASNTITHNLGTRNIIVQLYDTSTYDTVYGSVSRPTTNTATIGFSSTPTNSIRWMAYNVDVQGV
jgi:hypothetical protein